MVLILSPTNEDTLVPTSLPEKQWSGDWDADELPAYVRDPAQSGFLFSCKTFFSKEVREKGRVT